MIATNSILTTTTPTAEGKTVLRYLGVLGTEIIIGASEWKEIVSSFIEGWGIRNRGYEEVFEAARKTAINSLREKAGAIGAHGVLNIRFNYQVLGEKNSMFMVAATGTAVAFADGERRTDIDPEDSDAGYFLTVEGRERGPFSMAQLRQLFYERKIDVKTETKTEDGKMAGTLGELMLKNQGA